MRKWLHQAVLSQPVIIATWCKLFAAREFYQQNEQADAIPAHVAGGERVWQRVKLAKLGALVFPSRF
jgi:hypothetical protein